MVRHAIGMISTLPLGAAIPREKFARAGPEVPCAGSSFT
jgi:hypothetical protein